MADQDTNTTGASAPNTQIPEPPKNIPQTPTSPASSGPVDFSQAGSLDPLKVTPEPETKSPVVDDLSQEAKDISERTMADGKPANPTATPPTPQPAEPVKPSQTAMQADFGVTPAANPVTSQTQSSGNTKEPNGPMPEELKKWNWGAFFWSWIWGIANNTWVALLALLGPLSIIIMIILGVKGNEWAWGNRKFNGIEDFKKTQSAWAKWGVVALLIYLGMVFGAVILLTNGVSKSVNSTGSTGGNIEIDDSDTTSDGFQDLSDIEY